MTDLPSLKSLKGYQWHFRNMGFVTLESILFIPFPIRYSPSEGEEN